MLYKIEVFLEEMGVCQLFC